MSMTWMAAWICVLGGYLLGSISFAVVMSRVFGLADPRSYGSRNPGATNVLRSGSRVAALLTLLGDALKGAVAVWVVRAWGEQIGAPYGSEVWAGLGAFVGHLYPLYHQFKGGKGVATFLGVVAATHPWLGLIAGGAWLVTALVFRYSSLASITAAVLTPLVHMALWKPSLTTLALALMAAFLLFRHRENIARLRAGTESKLGKKKTKWPKSH